MKKFRGEFTKHYGGLIGKKFIYQNQPIYGCGEVVSYEYVNSRKGEIAIYLDYLTLNPTPWKKQPVFFSGVKDVKNIPFEIGDTIVFEGDDKIYDDNYARKRKIPSEKRTADKIIVVNQVKTMNTEKAIDYVKELLNDGKFETIYLEQQEKLLDKINKENNSKEK